MSGRSRRGSRGGGGRRALPPGQAPGGLGITAHQVQAAAHGVVVTDGKVELRDRLFRHAETIGAMPLLSFAKISKRGVDSDSLEGMVAIYDLLVDCIYQGSDPCGDCEACTDTPPRKADCPAYDPGDWEAFKAHANVHKVEGEELMGVVKKVIESLARGRGGSSPGSRPGSPTTSPSSTGSSSPRDTGVPAPPGGYLEVDSL
jgi:hypothetical protein